MPTASPCGPWLSFESSDALEAMRRSRWFGDAEGEGLAQPTVDAAIERSSRAAD